MFLLACVSDLAVVSISQRLSHGCACSFGEICATALFNCLNASVLASSANHIRDAGIFEMYWDESDQETHVLLLEQPKRY